MPPRELFFYVFGLAWRIHGISFVRTFEGKCIKHQGSNKSTYRACRLRGCRGTWRGRLVMHWLAGTERDPECQRSPYW